jgi:hypothetical protein
MRSVERLLAVCSPPEVEEREIPYVSDRRNVTSITFPPSYLGLLSRYGPGRFDDFIAIFAPGCTNMYLDLLYWTRVSSEMLAGKEMPHIREALRPFGVDPGDLIQWAGTDNADSFFWVPSGEPDGWPTLIVEAGQLDFTIIRDDAPGTLHSLLVGDVRCRFFPDDFPDDSPEFVPAF